MSAASPLSRPVLCIITDDARADEEIVRSVDAACAAVRSLVQLRVRNRSGASTFALAKVLRTLTRRHGSALVVNDRLDIALAVDADGVHLPAHGLAAADVHGVVRSHARLAAFLIGRSVHSVAEIERDAGLVDYFHFGPVFATPEKARFGAPLGVGELRRAVDAAGATPVIAVGGIDDRRAAEVLAAGAAGIAVIRAVMAAADAGKAARRLAASSRALLKTR